MHTLMIIKCIIFSFQVNGEDNRVQLWKDQLALQMIMMVKLQSHTLQCFHNGILKQNKGFPMFLKIQNRFRKIPLACFFFRLCFVFCFICLILITCCVFVSKNKCNRLRANANEMQTLLMVFFLLECVSARPTRLQSKIFV